MVLKFVGITSLKKPRWCSTLPPATGAGEPYASNLDGGRDIPNHIPCYQTAQTVPSNREPNHLLSLLFQHRHLVRHLFVKYQYTWTRKAGDKLTSRATLSPPQSIPSYVDSSRFASAKRTCNFTPSASAEYVSRMIRANSARWPGLPHMP